MLVSSEGLLAIDSLVLNALSVIYLENEGSFGKENVSQSMLGLLAIA